MQPVRMTVPRTAFVAAAAFLVLLGAVLLPRTLQAQSNATAPPIDVTATAGDKEALISWKLPTQVGACYIRNFTVYVYDRYARGENVDNVAGQSSWIPRSGNKMVYQWFLDELKPNTAYRAHVFSQTTTEASGCTVYSASSEFVNFTTNATNSGSDPSKPVVNALKWPLRPRDVSVSPTSAGATTATLTYKGARINGGPKRCAVPSTGQLTSYRIFNADTGTVLDSYNGVDGDNNVEVAKNAAPDTVRTVNLSGLTTGTKYKAEVSGYSSACDLWSRWRTFTWTQ